MKSFKAVFLVAVLTALTVMMAASAAVAQDGEIDAPVETFEKRSAKGVPDMKIPPVRPGRCTIRTCGSRCVRRSATVYYWWYGAPAKSVGSSTGEGGIIVRPCTKTDICPFCFRCLARKTIRVCIRVPVFCKTLPFTPAVSASTGPTTATDKSKAAIA
ncbi:hypothetical protein MMPV_001069 [Pyropia vietnamensis]